MLRVSRDEWQTVAQCGCRDPNIIFPDGRSGRPKLTCDLPGVPHDVTIHLKHRIERNAQFEILALRPGEALGELAESNHAREKGDSRIVNKERMSTVRLSASDLTLEIYEEGGVKEHP
jgi:hypothetical protein